MMTDELTRDDRLGYIYAREFPPLLVIGNMTLPDPGADPPVSDVGPNILVFPAGVMVFQLVEGRWEALNPPRPSPAPDPAIARRLARESLIESGDYAM